jgi:predicted alpha-1,2-mannosidase
MKSRSSSMTTRWFLPVVTLAVVGCGPSSIKPAPDQGPGNQGDLAISGGSDGSVPSDSGVPDDGGTPGADMTPIGPGLPDVTQYVNPFIGTANALNVDNPVGGGAGGSDFPGATVPWGMVAYSPDTPGGSPSGYIYGATSISGFSMTHFSGAGCANGGDLPLLALVDPTVTSFNFTHAMEHAAPGYYDVTSDANVRVELTATARTGMARITFPPNSNGTIVLDTTRSQTQTGITDNKLIVATTNDGITGYSQAGKFCGGGTYRIYFTMSFDRPWKTSTTTGGKAVLGFDTSTTQVVNVKIGLSYTSQPNATTNLTAENPGFDFDAIRAAAKTAWNTRLNAIQVTGGTADNNTKFYTALYHSLLHPNVYSDVNGDYMTFDGAQDEVAAGHVQYANFSGWDIYRSQVQLAALLFPDVWSDVVQSLVNDAQQCGAFPKWSQNNVEDNVMAGDPGALIVANSWAFGATNFDIPGAVAIMRKQTLDPTTTCKNTNELPDLSDYMGHGYTPYDAPNYWSASDTLEYGVRDAAVARFAAANGDPDLARITTGRSAYWRNMVDTAVTPNALIEPRHGDGTFLSPPLAANAGFNNGFTEASAEQYSWYVPHDLRSLFDTYGGNSAVVSRLDTFFTSINAGGSSAYCYIGNEPDFSAPFMYDWAGAPWRTQQIVNRSLTEAFTALPSGMAGNDDLGAMSSLIVWFMMGVYPEVPGVGGLAIASPSFPGITLNLGNGKKFAITSTGGGANSFYVQSAKLNGAATTSLWLPVATVLAGGSLDFALGSSASTWGGGVADAPPSFGPGNFSSPAAAYNQRGVSTDGVASLVNFDGVGFSYSSGQMTSAGVGATSFSYTKVTPNVTFPMAVGSTLDNFIVSGQTLTFTTTQKGGSLAWLGASVEGSSSGSGTITYSDGTTAAFTLGLTDWTIGGNPTGTPSYGNQIAVPMTARNAGTTQQAVSTFLFYASTPLDATRTIASVTMPAQSSGGGQMHVFSYVLMP